MGIKYNREYSHIVEDLSKALEPMAGLHEFLSMEEAQWNEMTHEDRLECIRTLSDDIIYSLGNEPSADIGTGCIEYDKKRHVLKVIDGPKITLVNLV